MKKLLTVLFVLISLIAKAQPSPTSSQVRFPAVWVQFRDTATARPSDTACIFYFNNNFWVRRNSSSFFQNLLDGSGTVTSIATNNGTGITGGTITTTGTLAIDTSSTISTKDNVLNQLNKYAGTTNTTTLGAITTGVWNGTAIANAYLANSSITVNAGTGLSGGGLVSLGGDITLNNAGVTSISGTANQITASASIGGVTLSIPTAFIAPGYIQATSNLIAKQNTNSATGVALYLKRDTDTGPLGYIIQSQNAAATANLFTVDVNGAVIGSSYTGNLVNALTFGAGLNAGTFNNSAASTVSIATGGVTNAMLANSTISGTPLGGTLPSLTFGTYLTGGSYNGTGAVTIATNATSLNTASTLVARDASGNFTAGAITAALSGNASTATTLQTARLINGVSFNGSADITITANTTNTLTIGTGLSGGSFNGSAAVTIANTGVLSNVAGTGITVSGATGNVTITNAGVTSIAGTANQITASASTGGVTLSIPTAFIAPGYIQATSNLIAKQNTNSATGVALYLKRDTDTGPLGYIIQSQNAAATANLFTVDVNGAVIGSSYTGNLVNALTFGAGLNAGTFNNSAASTVSIATGGVTNAMLANSTISGTALGGTLPSLTFGTYLTGGSYNGTGAVTLATNATALNTASTLVARDASGNFAAGTITAALSGNATTSTTLQTARLINGVSFNGSADITVTASTTAALTMNNSGAGAVSGTTFNGGTAQTISYNTIGAPSTTGTGASGTWGINVTGTAAGETLATVTGRGATTSTAVTFNGGHTSISALLSGVQPASVATNGTAATSILNATGGKGGNTTGTTGQIAGAGSLVSLVAGAGGDAPAGSTNGNGGNVVIQSGVAGSGLGTSGSAGTISLNIGGTTALGIAANQAVTLSGALSGTSGTFTALNNALSIKNVSATAQALYISYQSNTGAENAYVGYGASGNTLFSIQNNIGNVSLAPVSGNVGIGTSDPGSYKTKIVGGRLYVETSNENYSIGISRAGANAYYIGVTSSLSPDMIFSNNAGTENFRLAYGGAATFSSSVTANTFVHSVTTVTAAYTVADNITTVFANASTASFTVTLPAAASWTGRTIIVSRIDCILTNSVGISGSTDVTSLPRQSSVIYVSNGSSWKAVGFSNNEAQCN